MGRISIITEMRERKGVGLKLTGRENEIDTISFISQKKVFVNMILTIMHLRNASSFIPLSISMISPSCTQIRTSCGSLI